MIRSGFRLDPIEVESDEGLCTLPPGMEWRGILGTKFFSWHDGHGGGGAIDLVMHLGGGDAFQSGIGAKQVTHGHDAFWHAGNFVVGAARRRQS